MSGHQIQLVREFVISLQGFVIAIFKGRCLVALSCSLTFLIPYFPRKRNYNIPRKNLSFVDMGTSVKSGSNIQPHASQRLNLLPFLTRVTW